MPFSTARGRGVGGDYYEFFDRNDGAERAAISDVAGDVLFIGDAVISSRPDNRRQILRAHALEGGVIYQEVLAPGGVLEGLVDGSFLSSECSSDRCGTIWRYRLR